MLILVVHTDFRITSKRTLNSQSNDEFEFAWAGSNGIQQITRGNYNGDCEERCWEWNVDFAAPTRYCAGDPEKGRWRRSGEVWKKATTYCVYRRLFPVCWEAASNANQIYLQRRFKYLSSIAFNMSIMLTWEVVLLYGPLRSLCLECF